MNPTGACGFLQQPPLVAKPDTCKHGLEVEFLFSIHSTGQAMTRAFSEGEKKRVAVVIVDPREVSLHGWFMWCYSAIELQAPHRDSGCLHVLCGLPAAFSSKSIAKEIKSNLVYFLSGYCGSIQQSCIMK